MSGQARPSDAALARAAYEAYARNWGPNSVPMSDWALDTHGWFDVARAVRDLIVGAR